MTSVAGVPTSTGTRSPCRCLISRYIACGSTANSGPLIGENDTSRPGGPWLIGHAAGRADEGRDTKTPDVSGGAGERRAQPVANSSGQGRMRLGRIDGFGCVAVHLADRVLGSAAECGGSVSFGRLDVAGAPVVVGFAGLDDVVAGVSVGVHRPVHDSRGE